MNIKKIITTLLLFFSPITAKAITLNAIEDYQNAAITQAVFKTLHLESVANHKEFFTLTHAEQSDTYWQMDEIKASLDLPPRTWVQSISPLPDTIHGRPTTSDILTTMYIPLESYASPLAVNEHIAIKCISPSEDIHDWIQAASRSFSMSTDVVHSFFDDTVISNNSNLEFIIAYEDNLPVGCALNYYTADYAGIYWVGVDEKHRNKGIGTRLMDMALRRARQRRKLAFLQATPMGYPLYSKLGFMPLGYLGQY